MEMVRKQVHITKAQDAALARLSRQKRVPESELVRRALDDLFRRETDTVREDWMMDLVRQGSDLGAKDLADRHDDYEAEDDKKPGLR